MLFHVILETAEDGWIIAEETYFPKMPRLFCAKNR